jgi:hypothetical protein
MHARAAEEIRAAHNGVRSRVGSRDSGTEARLRELSEEIRELEGQASTAIEEFHSLSAGRALSEIPRSEHGKLNTLYQRAEDFSAKAERRRGQTQELMRELAEQDEHRVSGVTGPRAPLGLTMEGIKELHAAAVARRPHSVGLPVDQLHASIGTTEAPMAGTIQYDYQVRPFLQERVRIADHIPGHLAEHSTVHFFRAKTAAVAAAAVAPGGDKPESTPEWEEVPADIVKIAHFAKVQDEVIKDFGGFMDVMAGEMVAGLINEENDQLLNATGSGNDMVGLLETPDILFVDRDGTNAESALDCLLRAITALRTGAAFTEPDIIILNPNDFLSIRTSKASTSGEYLAGDPLNGPSDTLWGVPVIVTTTMEQGRALVGNLQLAAKVWWRETPRFDVNPYGGLAEWKANLTLVRAEERCVLAVERPKALCEVLLA